jgi:L-ribulose-5-phosphate 3-epimerase
MRKAINYWSFPGGVEGRLDLGTAVAEAKRLGFEGLEVCLFADGPLAIDMDDRALAEARRRLDVAGMRASSVVSELMWTYPLSASDPATRERGKWVVRQMLRAAHVLGADTVLVVPGIVQSDFVAQPEVVPYGVAMARAEEAMRDLAPEAERLHVAIGIENVWNKLFLSPLEARDFVDRIGSECVGWFLDVGNLLLTGFPEQWIRILGKRIRKVHLKDFRRGVASLDGFVDLLEGDVNWPEVMQALRQIDYDDYLIAEMVPQYHHAPELRAENAARALDKILAM